MKVTKTTAFKSEDGCLHETESQAINTNIIDCLNLIDHSCSDSQGDLHDDIIDWIRNHPKAVRYILANIKHAKKGDEHY
jgi:hypothetical protein